ncbi:unnamed protein product [Paramecium primaurelia]|uniref:Uncharacterized protein n=1 Tax=Paramecium primaurelia TaxID=5886 RepID=A0A8S1PUV0_PARPR|nr:unnamed protein product [Paramecium primaurelia]
MELAIIMSQFQQAIYQLQCALRKNKENDIMKSMLRIIFANDIYEVDQEQVKNLEKTFYLDTDTASILQILLSSFQTNGFPELEDYLNLLLYRIDCGICLLECHSSYSSSPLQFYSKYEVNERIQKEECIKKKIKKQKKKRSSNPSNNDNQCNKRKD